MRVVVTMAQLVELRRISDECGTGLIDGAFVPHAYDSARLKREAEKLLGRELPPGPIELFVE